MGADGVRVVLWGVLPAASRIWHNRGRLGSMICLSVEGVHSTQVHSGQLFAFSNVTPGQTSSQWEVAACLSSHKARHSPSCRATPRGVPVLHNCTCIKQPRVWLSASKHMQAWNVLLHCTFDSSTDHAGPLIPFFPSLHKSCSDSHQCKWCN